MTKGYLRVTAHKKDEASITRRVEIDETVTRTLATLRANGWYVDRWEHVELEEMVMKTYPVMVLSRVDDSEIRADLICCPTCPSSPVNPTPFILYQVKPGHLHAQCVICDETYCDGRCV